MAPAIFGGAEPTSLPFRVAGGSTSSILLLATPVTKVLPQSSPGQVPISSDTIHFLPASVVLTVARQHMQKIGCMIRLKRLIHHRTVIRSRAIGQLKKNSSPLATLETAELVSSQIMPNIFYQALPKEHNLSEDQSRRTAYHFHQHNDAPDHFCHLLPKNRHVNDLDSTQDMCYPKIPKKRFLITSPQRCLRSLGLGLF